jgi:hypothetical protein
MIDWLVDEHTSSVPRACARHIYDARGVRESSSSSECTRAHKVCSGEVTLRSVVEGKKEEGDKGTGNKEESRREEREGRTICHLHVCFTTMMELNARVVG